MAPATNSNLFGRNRSQQGQALIEMALIGTIAVAALGFLIQIGLGLNYEQENDQNAFRRALLMAKCEGDEQEPSNWCNTRVPPGVSFSDESQATTMLRMRDRKLPNPSIGFGLVPSTLTMGSATATWGERLTFLDDSTDSQPRVVVRVNDFPDMLYRSGDFPHNQPIVRNIEKTTQMIGTLAQTDSTGSATDATTTENTTVTMNDGSEIPASSVQSGGYSW